MDTADTAVVAELFLSEENCEITMSVSPKVAIKPKKPEIAADSAKIPFCSGPRYLFKNTLTKIPRKILINLDKINQEELLNTFLYN